MVIASKQSVIVLSLTDLHASALRGVLMRVAGPTDKVGRVETDDILRALNALNVGSLNCWDGEITSTSS